MTRPPIPRQAARWLARLQSPPWVQSPSNDTSIPTPLAPDTYQVHVWPLPDARLHFSSITRTRATRSRRWTGGFCARAKQGFLVAGAECLTAGFDVRASPLSSPTRSGADWWAGCSAHAAGSNGCSGVLQLREKRPALPRGGKEIGHRQTRSWRCPRECPRDGGPGCPGLSFSMCLRTTATTWWASCQGTWRAGL